MGSTSLSKRNARHADRPTPRVVLEGATTILSGIDNSVQSIGRLSVTWQLQQCYRPGRGLA
jgi:hypothetical protein